MTLWLQVHAGYPSYVESGATWRGIDHDANMYVQSLKGNPINGYVQLKGVDGIWRTATNGNPDAAFETFGRWAGQALAATGLTAGTLVPIPTSTAIGLGQDPKGQKLAATISAFAPTFMPMDALHWHEAMEKSSAGGTRDIEVLYGNLRILEWPPATIVLVDDVVSTGAHLIAAARALRTLGHTVTHAIAAAQTVWDHPPGGGIFTIAPRDLEADPLTN